MQAFDIFCRVVDHYGDAGVCWRLAQRLVQLGHPVRLWIDQIQTLARLVPDLDARQDAQIVQGVRIGAWTRAAAEGPPRNGVAIEAFACTPPAPYLARLQERACLWINLEYLSAEAWVEDCHARPSLQANGATKFFWFPGFTPATGGLLREADLSERRDAARGDDRIQSLGRLTGLPTACFAHATRIILLFCYPDAPVDGLQAALATLPGTTCLLVPDGVQARPGREGALRVLPIPFVAQPQFDELLWACDLNFVRGEDSLVRAIWAGAPLVWQPYPQAPETRRAKLDAWLARARWPHAAEALTRAWNQADDTTLEKALPQALQTECWPAWQRRAQAWSDELAQGPDLAQQLRDFCQTHRQTR